ncbi:hypothetical protein [Streptomyces sp. NBC_00454]|uniref:hypothetical protein n=1 Tax=Streptomyces sp. NBC_00454 TaxID=2975747 RepID=UPI0030E1E1E5
MGGRKHGERGRQRRPLPRRAVLLMAFGMLAGAVFLCARPAAGTGHAATEYAATGRAATAHTTAHTAAHRPGAAQRVFCVSPHDLPGCSPLSHVTPGVLPPPPPAVATAGGAAATAARVSGEGRVRPPAALARGPDLHVLQVLRT